MAGELVLRGLIEKRADIDGEVRRLSKQVETLLASRDAIDSAIQVLDPTRVVTAIKPRMRRAPPKLMPHGDGSKAVLAILRDAAGPMMVRDIVDQLAEDHGIDITIKGDRHTLIKKVRAVLGQRVHRGLRREEHGAQVFWSIGR